MSRPHAAVAWQRAVRTARQGDIDVIRLLLDG